MADFLGSFSQMVFFHGCAFEFPISDKNRRLHVIVDGISLDSNTTNAGLPQESVLSPILCLLYLHDLLALTCPIHTYADDSTLHAGFNLLQAAEFSPDILVKINYRVNELNSEPGRIPGLRIQ